jgi:hypothetical protein
MDALVGGIDSALDAVMEDFARSASIMSSVLDGYKSSTAKDRRLDDEDGMHLDDAGKRDDVNAAPQILRAMQLYANDELDEPALISVLHWTPPDELLRFVERLIAGKVPYLEDKVRLDALLTHTLVHKTQQRSECGVRASQASGAAAAGEPWLEMSALEAIWTHASEIIFLEYCANKEECNQLLRGVDVAELVTKGVETVRVYISVPAKILKEAQKMPALRHWASMLRTIERFVCAFGSLFR